MGEQNTGNIRAFKEESQLLFLAHFAVPSSRITNYIQNTSSDAFAVY
jgi:hypothetical protein